MACIHVRLTELLPSVSPPFSLSVFLPSIHLSIHPFTLQAFIKNYLPDFVPGAGTTIANETDKSSMYMKLQASTGSKRFYIVSVAVSIKTTIFKKFS